MTTRRDFLAAAATLPAGLAFAQPAPAGSEPVPFRYVIQNITLRSRGRVVIEETFKARKTFAPATVLGEAAAGMNYKVNLGKISASDIKSGSLVITQANAIPFWNGYIAMITLPAGPNGDYTFTEKDLPLELAVTVANPKPGVADHLIAGFMDPANLHAVAAASLGRVWGPFPPGLSGVGGVGGGSKDNWKDIEQEVSNPGISLIRQEQPQVPGDIILNRQIIQNLDTAPSVQMSVTVNAGGDMALSAHVGAAGPTALGSLSIVPQEIQPVAFYGPRMKVNFAQSPRVSAVIFAKTMPKAKIFMVEPQTISKGKAGEAQPMMIHGMGFGMDTKLEIVPASGSGAPARISGLRVGRDNMALQAQVSFPPSPADSYTVRVATGGQVASSAAALRFVP
jgi:hypothetical protein